MAFIIMLVLLSTIFIHWILYKTLEYALLLIVHRQTVFALFHYVKMVSYTICLYSVC